MDQDLLPLADAAARLGVSVERVRQLVAAGDLPGVRFGNAWAVPQAAVAARRHQSNRRGRPLGPRRAWAEILAGGIDLTAVSRYKHRARRRRGQLGPGDRAHLSDHDSVRISGVAAAIAYGEPLIDDPAAAVLYLPAGLDERLSRSIAFVEDELGSVILLVVDDDVWPLLADHESGGARHRLAPKAAVALDLMASDDPRLWQAAAHLGRARA